MLPLLFLAFTLIPVLEIWLLIQVGGAIGAGPTIAIVLVTGALGAWVARGQGFRVLADVQKAMNEGRLPGLELMEGALVLSGAITLVTPGMVTDATGFLLMVPPLRRALARWLVDKMKDRIQIQTMGFPPGGFPPGGSPPPGRGPIIDVTPEPPSDAGE